MSKRMTWMNEWPQGLYVSNERVHQEHIHTHILVTGSILTWETRIRKRPKKKRWGMGQVEEGGWGSWRRKKKIQADLNRTLSGNKFSFLKLFLSDTRGMGEREWERRRREREEEKERERLWPVTSKYVKEVTRMPMPLVTISIFWHPYRVQRVLDWAR